MRNEKDPQYYRGGLVYRWESGQLVITMTMSRLTPDESTSVTAHAHHFPLREEAEHLAGGGPTLVGVDLYHFSAPIGARLQLTITTRTTTYQAWYTIGETTMEAKAEETIWLDVLAANFSTLKRVVKGRCSCRPRRESIHVKPIIGQVQMH